MILNILHSFVNIFAGGRSDIKVIIFTACLVFLSILYLVFKNNSFNNLNWKWFGVNIFLMYIYGLSLHIFYTLYNNLSLTDFFITSNNGEISSSTLLHTHLAKGVIGQILYFFGKTKLETMDAGGAYIGLIPSIIFLFGTILFITITIQAICYFTTSFRTLIAEKSKRQKIFLILGYSILVFSLIRTSVDGGIFNPSFSVGVIFIILFILQTKRKILTAYYYIISFTSIVLLLGSLYIDSFRYGNGLEIASIAALLLLYNMILYGSEKEIRLQFFIPIFILFLIGWWVASARDRDIYNYSKILLPIGQEIYTYNENTKEVEISKISQSQTISQLSKKLNKNITYMPITIPGITCMEKTPYQKFSVTLITNKPIEENSFIPSFYMQIKNKESSTLGNNWNTILNVSMNQCTPEILSVFDGELQKNNIDNYILVNPSFYDTNNN